MDYQYYNIDLQTNSTAWFPKKKSLCFSLTSLILMVSFSNVSYKELTIEYSKDSQQKEKSYRSLKMWLYLRLMWESVICCWYENSYSRIKLSDTSIF